MQIHADHIVFCVGIEPDTRLAPASGLSVAPVGGFVANKELLAAKNIWVVCSPAILAFEFVFNPKSLQFGILNININSISSL